MLEGEELKIFGWLVLSRYLYRVWGWHILCLTNSSGHGEEKTIKYDTSRSGILFESAVDTKRGMMGLEAVGVWI